MNNSTRLIINTLAQNIRTILNIVLSLVSTRVVMHAIGHSDYGIYMLVAGIVSLLSYISNSLIIATQRHLNYSSSEGNLEKVRLVFANSYILHWIFGMALALICLCLTSWLFNGNTLIIPPDKMVEGRVVYYTVIFTVFITFISAPFKALLISHENIVFISIVEIIDGVLKLSLVFILFLFDKWRLPVYGLLLSLVMLFNLIMYSMFSIRHYEECIVIPDIRLWSRSIQIEIIGFSFWTLYGMICVYLRNQGIAVILNRFLGTIANAAFGIATQVFGSVQYLSQAILNAASPQIIQSEGANDRQRSIHLSCQASKFCYLFLAIVSVPIIFEMPSLLHIWIGDVPKNAVILTDMMLVASLCDQITIGLGKLNQAIGKIRNYTLITFTIKVLALPLFYFCLKNNAGIYIAAGCFIIVELVSAIVRIPILTRTAGIKLSFYLHNVIYRLFIPTAIMIFCCWLVVRFVPASNLRFIFTCALSFIAGIVTIALFSMEKSERNIVVNLLRRHE